jgi:HAE1 family hydrophobic/amphiphilic exporter-1
MTLPELAISRHITTLMILVSLAVLGSVALTRVPLAFLPDMEEPELFVRLPWPSASPEQVEHMVVRPVEDVLGSVKGLTKMWSECDEDGGLIRLEFDWSVNMHLVRAEVWEKIDRVRRELPEDLEDITVDTSWHSQETDDPILEVRISAQADLSESYDLLDRRLVRPFRRLPGVAQVRLDGINPREVRINLRTADLELHRMDVREVSRILRASNFNQSLGRITDGGTRYTLRTLGSFREIGEIGDLMLRADGLRLSDVADVVYQEPPLEYGRRLDGRVAVGLTVSAESKANVVEVCDMLAARLGEMASDPELEGLAFFVRFSEGEEIKKTLRELLYSGVFGAVLASVLLLAFLRRLSATLVVVLCIPFSLIVTCGAIWAQGKSINTMTLLGLIVGVGMLVDNAVVVIENIFRHQEEGSDPKTASRRGAGEVSMAVIAATLTSVIVFLPIIFNKPSEMNIQFREIGVTVCITLLASLFISQTLVPLATSWLIRSRPRPRGRWLSWLEERYAGMLRGSLKRRWLTPAIGIAIAASAVYPFLNVDINFSREENELYVTIGYEFSEDTTLAKKEEFVTRVEQNIEPHREEIFCRMIYSYWRDHFAMTRIYLREGEASEENLARARTRLQEILPETPGVRLRVQEQHRGWREDRGKRVVFRIVGEDADVLADLAEEARKQIDGIPGLVRSFARNREPREELHVEFERDLAARYNVTGQQMADTIGLTFRGRRLQRFRAGDEEREMRLTLDERETESVAQLHNLPLWTVEGGKVPLAAVAELSEVVGAERIERDDRLKSVSVGAEYESGTRDDYIDPVREAMDAMTFPYGYSWSFGSWQEEQEEKSREYLVSLILALLLVFAVMASLFESVQQAVALMIALPFALAGAIWTLYLTGTDFDQPAAVGVLLLLGIVVNNGIVMIEHINTYRRSGVARLEALVRGGRERLRPILMTALTTLIGLVPVIITRPSLGRISYYSMALVIAGGLLVSSFLTTILLPTTTTLVEDFVSWAGGHRRQGSPGGPPPDRLSV